MVGNTNNQLLSWTPVLDVFATPFRPMSEFGKYLSLLDIVLSFNQLQPLNPELLNPEPPMV